MAGLKLQAHIKGRKAEPCSAAVLRELREEDILVLNSSVVGVGTPKLTRIRDTHHALARFMAQGMKHVEISAITGVCQSRISILKNDPAFAELVEFYRENVQAKYLDVHSRLAATALEATQELHNRLMETPETIKTPELVEIAKMGLDRTGFGPTTKMDVRTAHFDAREMAEMKERVRAAEAQNVTTLTSTEDHRAEGGPGNSHRPVRQLEGPEGRGEEGLGLRAKGSEEVPPVAGE